MSSVKHRCCVMHLWRNFSKQWKDKELRGLVWKCARSATESEFNVSMKAVKRKNEKGMGLFRQQGSHNIRTYIMRKMTSAKLKMATRLGPLVPMQQSRLEKEKVGDPNGTGFVVYHYETRLYVDLQNQSCICRMWQLTGLPCRHVIAAIRYNNQRSEDYNDGMLSIGSYNATYENYIRPTMSQQYWKNTPFDRPTSPYDKKRPCRPKKCKRKDQNGDQVSNCRLKRSYKEITCTGCGLNGYNNKGCIDGGVPPRPKKMRLTALNLLHKLNNLQLIWKLFQLLMLKVFQLKLQLPLKEPIFIPPSMSTAFRPPLIRHPTQIQIIFPDGVSHNKNQPNYMSFIPTLGLPNRQDSKK
ncbi:hypothetical protein HKD37_09G024994 [Glycine soja]